MRTEPFRGWSRGGCGVGAQLTTSENNGKQAGWAHLLSRGLLKTVRTAMIGSLVVFLILGEKNCG